MKLETRKEETPLPIVMRGPRGDTGPMGMQGPCGETGPQGPRGEQGSAGREPRFPALYLGERDILVAHVGCGNMPPNRAKEYCEGIKDQLLNTFGRDQQIMVFPKRELDGIELQTVAR